MAFHVPQFIEVERKIVGPLSFRQFVFIAGGVGFVVMLWLWVSAVLAFLVGIPVALFGVALAFWKPYGIPFEKVVEAAFWYFTSRHLYLWKRPTPTTDRSDVGAHPARVRSIPRITTTGKSKLRELAFTLDVRRGRRPTEEDQTEQQVRETLALQV